MNSPILKTKLHRPPVTSDIIIRSRIIDHLEHNIANPFSLIVAPAGYGKSMTASMWLEHTSTKSTWFSIDGEHNDLRVFLLYLKAAIEKLFPGVMDDTSGLLHAAELPPIKVVSYAVINDIDRINENFILVLDDYHQIREMKIHHLINELLRYPPEHMHLSILSRVNPPLKTYPLSVKRRMTELRMVDLSFTEKEITNLFTNLFNRELTPVNAKVFFEKTEGWIVGLRIALLSVEKQEDADKVIKNLMGRSQSLSNYLFEEVILRQPERIQELMLITAELDRFCAELLDAIDTEKEENINTVAGEEFIQWLIRSNIFIIPLDDQKKWFRYHHLIRDLLQMSLKRQKTSDEISKFHRQASQWFEDHDSIEESIRHMLAAESPVEACNIFKRHRMAELDEDRWYVVQKWLKLLPEDLKLQIPEILLSEAWGAYENFELEKIPDLLYQTELLLNDDDTDPALRGEWYLSNGLVSHWLGNGKTALRQFMSALDYLPDQRKLATGMLHLHIALARGIAGKTELANNDLKKLLSDGKGSGTYITRLVAGLFYVNTFAGNLPIASTAAQRLQRLAKKHKLRYTQAMGICMEGCAYFNSYDLKNALQLFTLADRERYILHHGTALDALAGQTITHMLLGQPDEANTSLESLENFEKERHNTGHLPISQSCRARISVLSGDITSALAWERTESEKPTFAGLFVWIEVPFLTRIRVLVADGTPKNLQKAADLVKEFLKISKNYNLTNQTIEALALKSVLLKKQGLADEALRILAELVHLAEPGNYMRPFIELSSHMGDLLKELEIEESKAPFIDKILITIDEYRESVSFSQVNTGQILKFKQTINNARDMLSIRENEIIQMLANGLRNKEIADQLFIAEGTVKKHIYNVFQKWGVNNRINMLKLARKYEIIRES